MDEAVFSWRLEDVEAKAVVLRPFYIYSNEELFGIAFGQQYSEHWDNDEIENPEHWVGGFSVSDGLNQRTVAV